MTLTHMVDMTLDEQHRYDLASLAWMGFLVLVAGILWITIIPQLMAHRLDSSEIVDARVDGRDDADAIIRRFGPPEVDSAIDSSGGQPVRVLTYRDRGVRVAFVRRANRHSAPTWKLTGFLDLERDAVVQSGEGLKRLRASWH